METIGLQLRSADRLPSRTGTPQLASFGDYLINTNTPLQRAGSKTVSTQIQLFERRWMLRVLLALELETPRTFRFLEQALSGISPSTLSDRLKTLEALGLVERCMYNDHPPRADYRLSKKGLEAASAVSELLAALNSFGGRPQTDRT